MAGTDILLTTDDVTYETVKYETQNADVQIVQKIRMLLMTRPGDVLGAPDFGLDLEGMVFTFGLDESRMTRDIYNKIMLFISEASEYNLSVEVSFSKGQYRDACLIDILLNNIKQFGIFVK